jgi:hypothetical protein
MNKRFLTIIVLALLLLLSISWTSVTKPVPTSTTTPVPTLTYLNTAYGVQIDYPQDWLKKEGTTKTAIVEFVRPGEGASDYPRESYGIVIKDVGSSMKLGDYAQNKIQVLNLYGNYKLIDFSDTTLAGNPAQRIVYSAKLGSKDVKGLSV